MHQLRCLAKVSQSSSLANVDTPQARCGIEGAQHAERAVKLRALGADPANRALVNAGRARATLQQHCRANSSRVAERRRLREVAVISAQLV